MKTKEKKQYSADTLKRLEAYQEYKKEFHTKWGEIGRASCRERV